ncbi:hypothetical protein [Cytophaga sp. FL35]|uniref:hypothetical protein n=1 Tax=Cytophaga sp. FL35 TaxID=1904456 RepID=UPI001653EC77|nr:hypothetical protein [Cytophaga sp. FL35]MBC6998241.1 hypothetical protein [Cytophaga sp. FL35]
MMTFFTILLILVGANAIFMVFSLSGVSAKENKGNNDSVDAKTAVYPLQSSSKLKKAV